MSCLSHPPWLDHSNHTWRRVQVMKLLIINNNTPLKINNLKEVNAKSEISRT
jgi:hypothetical protein